MEVLEGQNILVTISGKKNKIRVYYLSWLNNKIFKKDQVRDFSVSAQLSTTQALFNKGLEVYLLNVHMHSTVIFGSTQLVLFFRMIEEMAG